MPLRLGLLLALSLALAPAGAAGPRAVPLTACTLAGAIQARCGTLVVPEDRASPKSRSISLRVAVLPARNAAREPDPIVYLAGGPGGSAIATAAFVRTVFSAANASRDLVLVDQRGTGGSASLACPLPRQRPTTIAAIRAFTRSCVRSLAADPREYTTAPAMDDLAEVLRALGYDQVNLVGGSYGGTAAQYFLVQHPEMVRSAILDGATLLDVPIFELFGHNGERALRSILGRCAASRRCAAAFPRVRREAFEVIEALRRRPVRSGGMLIDAASAAGALQRMTLAPESAAQIPWVAHEARLGRWDSLGLAVEGFLKARDLALSPMFWSIVCNEPWARRDPARSAAASKGTYLAERSATDARLTAAVCAELPKAAQPSWSGSRPSSAAPILFVVGGADPQDPLANVAGARSTMPNSRAVVVPGGGHGSLQLGCMPRIAQRFVETASASSLDTSCIARYAPPPFVVVR